VIGMCLVFLPFQPLAFPTPATFSLTSWLIMGLISLLLMAATLFVQYGITHIPVTRASVLFLFELVVAAVASYYWAGETMQWNEWLGGGLIILAAVAAARAEAT